MIISRILRRRREHPADLVKIIYLTDDEVWYRSLSENLGFSARSPELEKIYGPLVIEADRYERSLRNYFLVLGAGLLTSLGIVTEIDYSGVKFSQASLSLFILVVLGFTSFRAGWDSVKAKAAQGVFQKVWSKSNAPDRAFLMLNFPKAFGSHQYYASPNLHSNLLTSTDKLWRLIPFALLAFSAAVLLLVFPIYIFYELSVEVWNAPSAGLVERTMVGASISAALVSWLLPTGSLFKTRYQHGGLVQLLGRLKSKDEERYRQVARKINALKATAD